MSESSNASSASASGMSIAELNAVVERDPFLFVLCACDVAHLPHVADDMPHPGDDGFRLVFALNKDGPTLELRYDSAGRNLVLQVCLGACTATHNPHWMAKALKTQVRWMAEQGPILFIDAEGDRLCFQNVLPFDGLDIGALAVQIGDMVQKALDWCDKGSGLAKRSDHPVRLRDFIMVKGA